MSKREFNPATSSNTHSQARENAEITGLCADGERCGTPPEIGDEAYCIDCPNWSSADTAPSGTKHDEANAILTERIAELEQQRDAMEKRALAYKAGAENMQQERDALAAYVEEGS